jgi:lysophospholipase L1-like esterase
MNLSMFIAIGVAVALPALGGCGSSGSASDPQSSGTSSSGSSGGARSSGGSASSGSSGSSGGQASTGSSGGSLGSDDASDDDVDGGSGDDAQGPHDTDGSMTASGTSRGGDGGGACTKGAVMANEVVMLGDSYFDPAYSQAALDLFADAQKAGPLAANTTYRHYYQGGASMNNGALQFNIPYQYETQALTDVAVAMPKDIKVVIIDGGGNDVLINDRSCLTSAPPGNTGCASTIQGVVTRATSLLNEMATNGTQTIVYVFYPHLDPNGGGLLPAPNTADQTLDYAYPLAEQLCCGTTFTSSTSSYTCSGNVGSAKCIFVDTRPAFGDNWATLINKTDYVHPTPAGAQIIADLVWKAMVANCVAQ